jgi:hypothetical protein
MPNENVNDPKPGVRGGLAIVENAEAIARLYRRLVLLVGVQLLLSFLRAPMVMAAPSAAVPLSVVFILLFVGSAVALAATAYTLTDHLGAGIPILWTVAMVLPCINIVVLLVLSSKAQAWCKRYGVKVGLLGPTKASIEDLRRRMITLPFE